ncbi:site-determining protein [Striga asiatica]|uniref:Site-determining protein n=1 Tax=Striga asiatica TaxID=4170 RepID=A0A5A7QEH9_STRAF|nr:site-determining protein [Striga asiatica]
MTNSCCRTSAVKISSGGQPKPQSLPQSEPSSSTTQNPSHRRPKLSPPPAQPQGAALRRDSLRVVITSGKSGKTTTTANISLSLARLGFFVVAIDPNVGLRNFGLLISLENRIRYTVVEEDSCFSSSISPISAPPRDGGGSDEFVRP